MKLSLIYVNHNTTNLLLNSLKSAEAQLPGIRHEVIVVDNHSDKFDAKSITKLYPDTKVIMSPDNLGFGRGNNLGAKEASGEYLLIINTDTLIPTDHNFGAIIAFLDTHQNYGGALPLLTDSQGKVQPSQVAHFPSPIRILLNIPARLLIKVFGFMRPLFASINLNYAAPANRDVPVAVAAALFVRRSAFTKIGGFSPEFFMFYEDSDLCRKLHSAGYKIRWIPEAHLVHLWGQSITGSDSFLRRKGLYFDSQDVYLKKWHSAPGRWLVRQLRKPLQKYYRSSQHSV